MMEDLTVEELRKMYKVDQDKHGGDGRFVPLIRFISGFSQQLARCAADILRNQVSTDRWVTEMKNTTIFAKPEGNQTLWESEQHSPSTAALPYQYPLLVFALSAPPSPPLCLLRAPCSLHQADGGRPPLRAL